MENKIPTAEEFMTEHDSMRMPRGVSYQKEIGEAMIEFAKLHVEAALKEAADMAECDFNTDFARTNIENSYPLTNIK